jgi:anti-sigma regulatory factor (Ser/Thr protein kinase)
MGHPAHWSQENVFAADPQSLSQVRAFVGASLLERADGHLVADLQLVASELATNALVHTGMPFTVALEQDARCIRLTVSDGASAFPVQQTAARALDQSGRGLSIVEALSSDWGVRLGPNGSKSVWASFDSQALDGRAGRAAGSA